MDENSNLITQRISGKNHQIAGRDYITHVSHSEPKFDDGNPYKINCPQCGRVTGRLSTGCKNCDFPVREYFDQREIAEQKKLQRERRDALHFKGTLLVYGGLLGFAAIHWFDIVNFYAFVIAGLSAAVGGLIMNITSHQR
ncbi:hypothetical protein ACNO5E_18755 [Vibrio parahaemolyticus]|uniref:Uncharacterized protein n=1 Tax=bacterium 19MO03SA05 TaxID=2920620 RepID=A0AAU6VMJ1_UNCXX